MSKASPKNQKKLIVKTTSSGSRADSFVASQMPDFSRSSLKNLFREQYVSVNHKPVKASHRLKSQDVVTIATKALYLKPREINLPLIYEDDDVIVINKPSGILTHAKGAINTEPSIATFILSKITDSQLKGNRAGIVHRLDRATSGVIICAKNFQAQAFLQKQFSTRKVKKTYLAIVEGQITPPAAMIDIPIQRNPKKPQTFRAARSGKSAQTKYELKKVIARGPKSFSLLELKPITGRTHQLRVHLAHIGYPVAGDSVYGRGDGELMLHGASLELVLPSGQPKIFEAPSPAKFTNF